ncbi:MAG: Bacterial Ig-like domain, partial [Pseudomonadota bacterium]
MLSPSAASSRLRRALGVLALTLAACAGEPTPLPPDAGSGPKFVDPTNTLAPKGTLQGAVVDAYDQVPLPGAKVTLNYDGASKTYTTGADGTFSFADIPASANPNGDEAATGQYTVVLDLTGVQLEGRKYKPYRTQRVSVQFTQLTQPVAAGGAGAQAPVADRNPVSYLVSNVTFSVQQARARVSGRLLSAPDLKPIEAQVLLVAASSTGTVPAGATAAVALADATTGAFTFQDVEEGLNYRIAPADQGLVLDLSSSNNYSGSAFYAAELGATTVVPTVVVIPRPAQDTREPFVVSVSPRDEEVLPRAQANANVTLTFSEAMNTVRPQDAVVSIFRLGRRGQPDDAIQPGVPFVASWDGAGKVLTVDPRQDLLPGYRYRLFVSNAGLLDAAGNARTGNVPGTSPQQLDALAVTGGSADLDFAVSAEAGELVVTNLAQEPDTADNVPASTVVRASVLEQRADATERSFMTHLAAGDYESAAGSHCAYIAWTAPAEPVVRYQVYARKSAAGAAVALANHAGSLAVARRMPLAGTRTGYQVCLDELSAVFTNAPAVSAPLPNTTWDNGLSVELGVAATNLDGVEGPITWVPVKDNTAPALRFGGLGFDATFNPFNGVQDAISLADNAACTSPTLNRVMCPQLPSTDFAGMVANAFGQRVLLFELSEPIDPASVLQANVKLSTGLMPTRLTVTDPNTVGGSTESDAAISGAAPYEVVNGRTKLIAVRVENFYGIDTGDVFALRQADSAGIRDLAGNVAKDDAVSKAPFVDSSAPMLKAASYDGAANTLTFLFTRRLNVVKDADATRGNFDRGLLAFDTAFFDEARAGLQTVNHSYNAHGDSQLVFQFTDVGYLRGFNSTHPSCAALGGTRVRLNGVGNADVVDSNGTLGATNSSDTGTQAYVNLLRDPAQPNAGGAYMPGPGEVGTRSTFEDKIGPRLSSAFADRSLSTANNAFNVSGTSTSAILSVDVRLTEPATPAEISDVAKWNLKLVDLGGDFSWASNQGNDVAAANASAAITSVALNSVLSACSTVPTYRVSFRITNNDGNFRTFGVGEISLSPTVTD